MGRHLPRSAAAPSVSGSLWETLIQADIQANRVYSGTNRLSQANIKLAVDKQNSIRAHRGTRRLPLRASLGKQSLAALLGAIIMCLIFDIYQPPARDAPLLVRLYSEEVVPAVLTVVILHILELWRLTASIGIRPATGALLLQPHLQVVEGFPLVVTHPPNHGTASLLRLCLGAVMTCRYRPHICQRPLYSPMPRRVMPVMPAATWNN